MILLAPSTFKGTMASRDVSNHIKSGIISSDSNLECKILSISDGGDDFLQSLYNPNFDICKIDTIGPLGDKISPNIS